VLCTSIDITVIGSVCIIVPTSLSHPFSNEGVVGFPYLRLQ
jgi:hypothetical protein